MKKRTVTSRNFWGGFWGGFFGIFVFAVIHPTLIPVGCLTGVMVGYWYDRIIWMIIRSCRRTIALWRFRLHQTHLCLVSKTDLVRILHGKVSDSTLKVLYWVRDFFDLRESSFLNWLKRHPMNRALTIRMLAAVILMAMHLYCAVFSWDNFLVKAITIADTTTNQASGLILLGVFLSLFLWATIAFCLPILFVFVRQDTQRDFYKEYERYVNIGSARYFLSTIGQMFLLQLLCVLVLLLNVTYYILLALFYLIFLVVPLFLFAAILRGLCSLVLRKNHWMCFGVTLFTTMVFALLMGKYLNSPAVLWITALATGCVSGALAEAVRRILSPSVSSLDEWVFVKTYSKSALIYAGKKVFYPWWRSFSVLDKITF